MKLGSRHGGGADVPVEGSNGADLGCVVLETILVWGHQVSTFILGHLDLPFPSGGGGARVNVNVDGVAAVRGRYEHMLACV